MQVVDWEPLLTGVHTTSSQGAAEESGERSGEWERAMVRQAEGGLGRWDRVPDRCHREDSL